MRNIPLLALVSLLGLTLAACCTCPRTEAKKTTFSSFDIPTWRTSKPEFPAGSIYLQNASLDQVLTLYQEISGRTVIRSVLPGPTITVRNQTPLTRIQALQLLDTVLSEHGIAMLVTGDIAVKAVPEARAVTEVPPNITLPLELLPESGSFMTRTVHLKKLRPSELIAVLMPVAKMPNAVLPIDSGNLLIIRDYSANVRRMLQMIEELEKNSRP